MKIGIIGCGYVGESVKNAFKCESVVVDPAKTDNTVEDLKDVSCAFICVPTPSAEDGSVDGSLVKYYIEKLPDDMLIIVKSTVTPDYLDYPKKRLVYNPEFLTQRTAGIDFINPDFMIFGGKDKDCEAAISVYKNSAVRKCPIFKVDIKTASMVKYALNCYYATKVTFMNEMRLVHAAVGCESTWDEFIDILKADSRMSKTHMQVPGPDGYYGFGGACFPKDTKALIRYAHSQGVLMSVLLQAVRRNEILRNE